MLNFQDQLADDLEIIFFNPDNFEFATEHTIGVLGSTKVQKYNIIIDNAKLSERKIVRDDIENIYLADLLFFIQKKDLGFTPKVNSSLIFDNKQYLISEVNEYNDVLEITLTSNNG